jgi:hypothetical protein
MSISADLIRNIDSLTGGISSGFSAFALATSIITLITIIPMCALDPSQLPHDDVTLIPSCAGT